MRLGFVVVFGPDEAARRLQCQWPGWVVWFGRHTGRYWAVPAWSPATALLVEAATPDVLDAAMSSFELLHRRPARRYANVVGR